MDKELVKGHRNRLRERYLQGGYTAFQDYEILEILLGICIPRKDTKPMAKELLKKFKTVEGVLKGELEELMEFQGISRTIGINLKFLGDLSKYNFKNNYLKSDVTTFDGKRDLIGYLKNEIGFGNSEEFMAIFLNSANELIKSETLFKGTIDRSAIYPRKILEKALEYNARSVIFAHNHPSGKITPSKKDIELTKEMENILKVVDVKLLDHIIITKESYLSFLEEGFIDYY